MARQPPKAKKGKRMRGGGERRKELGPTYIYVGAGRTCVLAPMTFRDSSKGGTFWTGPPILLLLAQVPNQKEMDKRDIHLVFLPIPTFSVALYLSLCFAKLVVKISCCIFRYFFEKM